MQKTPTERSRKHAERNPDDAAKRKQKQRSGETEYRTLAFWARHHHNDISKMPEFPNAKPGDRERAIKEAKAAHGVEFLKIK